MNWIEFLFGWLYKGQYNISILDYLIFVIEFIIVILIIASISVIIEKLKKGKKKNANDES